MPTIIATQKKLSAPAVSVDYPQQDEKVVSKDYSVRVSADDGAAGVEVSIDQGPWQACRQAIGYWWHDWTGYDAGEHEVIARAQSKKGKKILSAPKEFVVEFPSA